jgi:uncharacterized membrane protein
MVAFIVLAAVALLARLAGQLGVGHLRDWSASTRLGLAAMFCFTAAAHFNSMRADMVAMIPPSVPNPEMMVTFTGICEVLGALGLLVPRTRRIAAVALIVFLVAVLPANIHAAQAGVTLRGSPATPIVPRVALQGLFIALLWWSGVRRQASGHDIGARTGLAPERSPDAAWAAKGQRDASRRG